MRASLFISLAWALCTAFPSSPPENAAQSEPRMLPNLELRMRSDDDNLFWTDDSSNSDATTYDAILAPDANAQGFLSEQNPPLSISSGNDIDGLDHGYSIALNQEESTTFHGSAESLEDFCSATAPASPSRKVRLRNDAYCPSPETVPLSTNNLDIPSLPNMMEQNNPQVPIDVPLFNLKNKDDQECPAPGYVTHLCCDGPRGPWDDRWFHYDFVSNCLPFIGTCKSVYHEWCCNTWLPNPGRGTMCRIFPGLMVPVETESMY